MPPVPKSTRTAAPAEADAEAVALRVVEFLARDDSRLHTFLGATGLTAEDLTGSISSPAFLAAVLDYLLQDEALLLEFAAAAGLSPEAPLRARRKLPGMSGW